MSQPFNPHSPRNNPRNRDYRIGDAERQKAMDDLGKHFTAGRLDITEYDNRLTNVAEAIMWSDLIPIFSDPFSWVCFWRNGGFIERLSV